MKVFLTGGTGYIGSAVLAELVRSGHEVSALARSGASAGKVEAAGARAVRGGLTDGELLAREAASADGVIHAASPGDATNADADTAVLDAVLPARTGGGELALLYPGRDQHFSNVYIEDIAALYALALAEAAPGSYYLGTSGENPSMRDLAVAASHTRGLGGRIEPEAPMPPASASAPLRTPSY